VDSAKFCIIVHDQNDMEMRRIVGQLAVHLTPAQITAFQTLMDAL
jgi:hypothetical protein